AIPGTSLTCTFELQGDALSVAVSVPTTDGVEPSRTTFAWTVLTALAGEVDSRVSGDGTVTIELIKRRAADPS
ncbi:MAG: serine/threonine-protein kinase RsbW, partial [Actinomycetota bacterium]|nr:serine/threonine-protein kinase RsbW [Actinomycetota bacterium]